MAFTVRGLIRDIQREVLESASLEPIRAAELETKLSALLGNVLEELRESELHYKRELLRCLKAHDTANRARIEADTSTEYARFREAKDAKDLTVELIRSLRQYLRNAAEEARLTR